MELAALSMVVIAELSSVVIVESQWYPHTQRDLEYKGRFSSSRLVRQSDQFSILNVTNVFSNDLSLKVKEEL